ncbi:M23 family metallopeptidase [Brevibacillus dissolubilis]|uniref:M23 family metallopeptidase n=1 Tax=Brevibacillus dissolubilis TaxID=1844116 RepID=UPI00159BA9D3|nr:M23 family metallopeptidase [Brevibacillus dissolubilis]
MFNEIDRIRERRRERKEQIILQTRDSFPPFMDELHDPIEDRYTPATYDDFFRSGKKQQPVRPPQEVLGIQVFFSLVLVGVAYVMFQTQVAVPEPWKQTARDVLTRDFNFQGVADWYEARFGTAPTVLPVLSEKKTTVPATTVAPVPEKWQTPAEWKLVKAYDPQSAKMVVDTGLQGQVITGEDGWVIAVEEKPGFGLTVVVQYASGREIWFGNLESTNRQANDWLKQGDTIGLAKVFQENARYLFLAMKQNGKPQNPADVVALD